MSYYRKYNPAYIKAQKIQPVAVIEGYSVYYFKTNYWWSGFSAELVDKDMIFVYGNKAKPENRAVSEFVTSHLDGLIDEDMILRGLKRPATTTKTHIELNSYCYVNPRRDIDDDPSVKAIKRKMKSSRIERTYSTPYYGEVSRNIIGMRGVSADGRLITIEQREDYGLRDRN